MKDASGHLGFTMIELLAVMAITALLAAGVLTTVATVSRDRSRMKRAFLNQPESQARLVDLLRRDIACAREIGGDDAGGRIELIGYASIDPRTGERQARPAQIVYEVVSPVGADAYANRGSSRGRGELVRRQRYLDDPRDARVWSELIERDVASITLTHPRAPTGPAGAAAASSDRQGAKRTLTLRYSDPSKRPTVTCEVFSP